MSFYDAPPLRSYRASRRRDSFSTPPLRTTASFYPYDSQPQTHPRYADEYPRGRPRSPYRDTTGMPRIYRASPDRDSDSYAPSPMRSSSPGHDAERSEGYYRRSSRARELYEHEHSRDRDEYRGYDTHTPESPPPQPYTPTHSHSYSHIQPQFTPTPSSSPRHHNPVSDTSPSPYTYSDDEPERIPIAPMPWNGNSTSASKEELVNYLIDRGVYPKVAAAQIDREFTDHAPQYEVVDGERAVERVPRAQMPGPQRPRARGESSDERYKEEYRRPSPESGPESRRYSPPTSPPQSQRRPRRREPPLATYRSQSPFDFPSHSPIPDRASSSRRRHRDSSSSRYRASSPPRRHGTYFTPPRPPSPESDGARRYLSRREFDLAAGRRGEREKVAEREVKEARECREHRVRLPLLGGKMPGGRGDFARGGD